MSSRPAFRGAILLIAFAWLAGFPAAAQNRYAGAKACAPCHPDHYQSWEKSRHAGAVRTLAKRDAAGDSRQVEGLFIVKMGRGEKYGLPTPAAEFPHCLICHTTAPTADSRLLSPSLDRKDGVQCEACHGPASAHARVETLKQSGKPIPAAEVAAALDVAKAVTLRRYASEKEIEAFCTRCHDGMCGDFDFVTAWPKVRHSREGTNKAEKSGVVPAGR